MPTVVLSFEATIPEDKKVIYLSPVDILLLFLQVEDEESLKRFSGDGDRGRAVIQKRALITLGKSSGRIKSFSIHGNSRTERLRAETFYLTRNCLPYLDSRRIWQLFHQIILLADGL